MNDQEESHGTLVGADGTPVPLYEEVSQIGAEFQKTAAALAGTTVEAQVAVLQDYDSRWAINWQRLNQAFDPITSLLSFYGPLRELARSVDIVADTASLARYKLVVAPAHNVLTPVAVKNLEAYVRGRGHLVLGQRSGMKDADNALNPERQPGPLASLLGARVEQFYALDKTVPITGDWGSGENAIWADQLKVTSPDARVLMRYGKSNGWLDGQPAAVTRAVGKGSITYIGASLDVPTMSRAAAWMMTQSDLQPVMPNVPKEVDVAIRSGSGKGVVILTNYSNAAQNVTLPNPMESLVDGSKVSAVTLPPFGVAVLR